MKRILLKVISISVVGVLLFGCNSNNQTTDQYEELTLADASVVWWMGPGIIAQHDSLYLKNGLKVKSFDVQTGLASKNAVLSGSADVGLVASSPLALGAFSDDNLVVLCSYVETNSNLALLTPKTEDTARYSKPVPTVAIVKGTISEMYLYNYLKKYYPEESLENIKQVYVKPPDVPNAMRNGDAKSAVIWEPFATMIAADPSIKVNRSEDIYTFRIYVVCTPETLNKKREAINRFVASMGQACEALRNNPKSREVLKETFPNQEVSMNALWDKMDFSLKFDYDRMKEIILKDAQITYELGQTPKDKSGNLRELKSEDLDYYFEHDFKLTD